MTYPLRDITEARLLLPKWDLDEAIGAVTQAAENGEYVSVRVQDIYWPSDDVTETRLDHVSVMTEDEYIAYRQNGGQWTYIPATQWLDPERPQEDR